MSTTTVNDISATAFLTLMCHAIDAKAKNPILSDFQSIHTIEYLLPNLSNSKEKMHRQLSRQRLDKKLVTHICLRANYYDDRVRQFIEKHPNANIINIASGLDDRFGRIDNGAIMFYDIDLPDIMQIKSKLFPTSKRYHQLEQSVFDCSWMKQISDAPTLLLAEGLFMYCQEAEIKQLFQSIQAQLPNSRFVFELFNSYWLHSWRKPITKWVLHRKFKFGKDAFMTYGLRHGKEISRWSEGYEFIKEWSYFDSKDPRIGWLSLFRWIPVVRKTLWTLEYQIHGK